MKPSSVSNLAGLISRSLISTSHSSLHGQWTRSLEQTLHRLHFRESLSPPLVAMVIDPHLLHYPSLSLGFFNWASQQPNFSHSSTSYNSVLKSLSASLQFGALEKILKQARSHGIPLDPSIYGSIIVSRVKAGQPLEGYQLFSELDLLIKDLDPGCCNSLLAALASHGYSDYVNKVFNEMLVRGVSFSTLGFGVFIWNFCKNFELDRVLGLWNEVKNGISEINDSIAAVLLVHGFCKTGKVLDAQRALEELRIRGCKPDFLAYRVVAVSLRSMGYLAEVEIVLKKKRKLGVAPRSNEYREFVFSLISEGHINLAKELGQVVIDGDFPIEDDVLNALASSVSTIDPCSALLFLQYMIEKERLPTLLTLKDLGKNLCDHGKVVELGEILQKLSSYDYFMDIEAYSVMVSLLCTAGKVREAYGVLREMRKNGLTPDISSYNELIEALCREDLLRPARKLWDEMFANGMNGNVQTYTILINKFSETSQIEEAIVLLNQMVEKGLKPDVITYSSLLERLCQDGKIEASTKILQKAVDQDRKLLGMMLTPLVHSLCKGGHFFSASGLLCGLNYNGVLLEPNVILLKYLADAGQIQWAVEHVKRIKINSAMLLQDISNELLSLVSSSSNPEPILQLLQEIYTDNIIPVHNGVEGGFDENEAQYEESHNIVLLPSFESLSFPSVELPEKVRLAVDAILLAEGAERKEQVAAWVADKKQVSAFAMDLLQIDNGVVVPPSGWKCSKCDKTENLWLNLTDGMILCGRRNFDGSGGNNHAVEHYNETRYPLAVKLGTITADLEAADVYSYPEDESVLDPNLAQHLAFFGIDFSSLQKTELTTAERELDQNTNYDWNRIQESGQEMAALYGPGYTGLVNLGNSCYLASTMQIAFTTSAFRTRYYAEQDLEKAFKEAPADPTVDLNMQLIKLGHGLLSGKYSVPVSDAAADTTAKQVGIRPHMFKTVIAASHPEFSTMRQQDALEFFLHLLEQVERVNGGNPQLDPSRSFKFGIEDRIQCPSGKVTYSKRFDYILSLNIPLHEATNKDQLESYNKLKAEMKEAGNEISFDEIVRPTVPLEACLASYSAPEEVQEFYSTALKTKTTAIKNTGLTSFPDYLVLHMRKFVLDSGWVPRKLDVYVDVPDTIDISHMRSKGLQPGEELLPENVDDPMDSEQLSADEAIVSQLVSMGFTQLHCQKAAINTSNAGIEEAMNWLLSHMDDPDIDAPISQGSMSDAVQVDQSILDQLVSFGFTEEVARTAILATGNDVGRATDWIFSNPNASAPSSANTSVPESESTSANLPDGSGRYKLLGFISHMGTSTQCGHYVAHIQKDGRWVIFNDDKVGASVNPPKNMGYLYFFERLKD